MIEENQKTAKKVSKYKEKNKTDKLENFLILEASAQNLIFNADVTATAKLILVYLLSKVDMSYKHLYVFLPYSMIDKDIGIKKTTASRALKSLVKSDLIYFLSGKNRKQNNLIREFIFGQKQYFDPMRNQPNIIDMTPFFLKILEVQK